MRRVHWLRYDMYICLLLAAGVAWLAGRGVDQVTEQTYVSYEESKQVADGEVGGVATDDIFRITCIDDIRSHELFTLETEGITYRNEGGGYFENHFLYGVLLPSGERVAMSINNENVVSDGDYYSGINTLPVGRLVEADLEADEYFMNQVNHDGEHPLTATDFYVDMVGDGARVSEESYKEGSRTWVQIIVGILTFVLVHILGARIGIFPYFIVPKRLREQKSEWE